MHKLTVSRLSPRGTTAALHKHLRELKGKFGLIELPALIVQPLQGHDA